MFVLSRLHPRQSLLESLEVRPRHQYFSSTPGCAAQVENDASQKRSCHGTWVVGRERPRAGEVLTLQGATDWAALSTSCLFPSPRLHTVSWSQAGAETEANAQLQSQSPRQHQCHVGLEAELILLWSWARRGGRHHFSPSAPLS